MVMIRTVALILLLAAPASAGPIFATLDGCVSVNDPRLVTAIWSAVGTFATAAFRDDKAGCAPTIEQGIDGWVYDEDRLANTLETRIHPGSLPTCGRVHYDAQVWLEGVPVDGTLKALVVDSGVDCGPGFMPTPELPKVAEPWTVVLLAMGGLWWRRKDTR
jgi:hypothetical protein